MSEVPLYPSVNFRRGGRQTRRQRQRQCARPRKALRTLNRKSFLEDFVNFGDKCPRNGSKNGLMAPRTGMGCPHIGSSVDPRQGRAHRGRVESAICMYNMFCIKGPCSARRQQDSSELEDCPEAGPSCHSGRPVLFPIAREKREGERERERGREGGREREGERERKRES